MDNAATKWKRMISLIADYSWRMTRQTIRDGLIVIPKEYKHTLINASLIGPNKLNEKSFLS